MNAPCNGRRRKPTANDHVYLAVVKKKNGETSVLVVRRKRVISDAITWAFPGGKRNSGETPEECLRREVFEETSCLVVVMGEISQRDVHPISGTKVRYYACVLEGDAGKLKPPDKTEISEVKWMTLAEIEEALPGLDSGVKIFLKT